MTDITRREGASLLVGAAALPILGAAAPRISPRQALRVGRDQSLDQSWRFFRGEGAGFEQPDFDDAAWRIVDLPHDWSIEDLPAQAPPERFGAFDAHAEAGGATGFTIGGEGWYRKHVDASGLTLSARAEILFDGAYAHASVWLNGHLLGEHAHGYAPFSFDLTPYLDRRGDNVVAVRVRNLGKNSRWYSGSGLYRSVSLDVISQPSRIARWGVAAWTRRIGERSAEIEVKTSLLDLAAGLHLRTRLRTASGDVAAEAISPAEAMVAHMLNLHDPHLWSPGDPYLYTLESDLIGERDVIDRMIQPYGVRIVSFDARTGMQINGETTRLRGGCVHHDNGLLGSAAHPDADERRVLRLKARGFNAIRSAHNPPSRSLREACERHGILMIAEAFDMWLVAKNPDDYARDFEAHWREDLAAMVLCGRNSPSIIMWSIGNEIPGRDTRPGMHLGWSLANAARALDPSRPVTAGINGFPGRVVSAVAETARSGQAGKPAEAALIFLDVPGYNYRLNDIDADHARHPDRVVYASETFPHDAFDYEALGKRAPHMLGEFVWTAMDYIGEAGIGAAVRAPPAAPSNGPPSLPLARTGFPWVGAYCGDLDLIGDQKPQSLFRDVVWGKSALEVVVHRPIPDGLVETVTPWGWPEELSSWTWPGAEGKTLALRVYSSGDKIEVSLNGATIATKMMSDTEKLRAEFNIPYAPGALTVTAYRNGVAIATKRLQTAGAPRVLRVTPEKAHIRPDRKALAFVAIEVLDASGRLCPDAALDIGLRVSGPAQLIGFGSGNPRATGSFQSNQARSFQGRALAIFRANGQAGVLRLQAGSAGLASGAAAVQIN